MLPKDYPKKLVDLNVTALPAIAHASRELLDAYWD
jgi:hypothetical protein